MRDCRDGRCAEALDGVSSDVAMRLWCQECGRPSGPEAKGWRLYRSVVPEEEEQPTLAAYCPVCAYVEFGGSAAERSESD